MAHERFADQKRAEIGGGQACHVLVGEDPGLTDEQAGGGDVLAQGKAGGQCGLECLEVSIVDGITNANSDTIATLTLFATKVGRLATFVGAHSSFNKGIPLALFFCFKNQQKIILPINLTAKFCNLL